MAEANITTSTLVNLVTKGYEKIFADEWNRTEKQYPLISKQITMDNKTWLSHSITGVGAMTSMIEGNAPTQDDVVSEYALTLTGVNYGKKWLITKNMLKDDQYDKIRTIPVSAANAANEIREVTVANMYNNAYTTAGYDTVVLCATTHPLNVAVGGTQANILASAATLEKQSLRDMMVLMRQLTDQKSLIISQKPKSLLVPNELMFDAEEIIMSPKDSETNKNAVTPKAQAGLQLIINDRLTNASRFFVLSDVENIYFALRDDISKEVNPQVDGSRNIIYDVHQRFAVGFSNYRDVVGNGATS
jgi:phage major head subunit gpT-like protein